MRSTTYTASISLGQVGKYHGYDWVGNHVYTHDLEGFGDPRLDTGKKSKVKYRNPYHQGPIRVDGMGYGIEMCLADIVTVFFGLESDLVIFGKGLVWGLIGQIPPFCQLLVDHRGTFGTHQVNYLLSSFLTKKLV